MAPLNLVGFGEASSLNETLRERNEKTNGGCTLNVEQLKELVMLITVDMYII
jgi:hypothetical protein